MNTNVSTKALEGTMDRSARMLLPRYGELMAALATRDAGSIHAAASRIEIDAFVIVSVARQLAERIQDDE